MVFFYSCSYRKSSKMKYLYVVDARYLSEFDDFCSVNNDLFRFDEIPYDEARYAYAEDVDCIIW